MKRILTILFAATLLAPCLQISAALVSPGRLMSQDEKDAALDSINRILATQTTAADSVPLLYDILDLTRYNHRTDAARQLTATALRGADPDTRFDAIRRLAATCNGAVTNPELIDSLIDLTAAMPQSHEQRATLAFLRMQEAMANASLMSESERQQQVHDIILKGGDTQDPYSRIENLFVLCRYLQDDVSGHMLSNYLDELGTLIDNQKIDGPLRSAYAVQASIAYTASGQHEKAIEQCRSLIALTDSLNVQSHRDGRQFRNYDTSYYVAYRRMLSNYEALEPYDIENIYSKVLDLAARNKDVESDLKGNRRATIYYLMSRKDYRHALDILKQQIDNPANKGALSSLYEMMLTAATECGDRDAMLTASTGLIDILRKSNEERSLERSREMQILEELQIARQSNNEVQNQRRREGSSYHKSITKIMFFIGVALLIVILILALLFRRAHKLTLRIRESNDILTRERDSLRKTQSELIEARDHARRADRHKLEFINNMSHEVRTPLNAIVECSHLIVDNVDEDKRRYLKRYADMIDVSADMLQAFVSDVLDIASLEKSQIEIDRKAESVGAMCMIAVESMRKHCKPGVTMTYLNSEDDDISIRTDARRVEQVLINLLSNGAKFTDEGFVNLSYQVDPVEQTITFIVADSGIGVPKGKEEIIFERFEKLSNLTSGTGLGLNISRMVAERLGGSVKVDTTYPGPGARFLFTLPLE